MKTRDMLYCCIILHRILNYTQRERQRESLRVAKWGDRSVLESLHYTAAVPLTEQQTTQRQTHRTTQVNLFRRRIEMASHLPLLLHLALTRNRFVSLLFSHHISYKFICSSFADVIFVGFVLFMAAAAAANKAILLKNHYTTKGCVLRFMRSIPMKCRARKTTDEMK